MKLGISALIQKTNAEGIEMFKSLATQSRVAYGTVKSTNTLQKFHESRDETFRQMYHKMVKNNWVAESVELGLKRVKLEAYALIQESATNEFLAANDCDLTSIRDYSDYFKIEYAIILPKNSPYKAKFNYAIKQLEKDGVFDKLKNKYWHSNCKNTSSSLINIWVIIILVLVIILAIAGAIWYFFMYKRGNNPTCFIFVYTQLACRI